MLALMLVLAVQQTPAPMRSGEDVLRAMHDRYAGHWFTTLTFTQHNTATRPDGSVQHSTWKEYASLPGRLRIDFLPADSGNGAIYARDSQFTIQGHALKDATPFVHPLMVLGFDVYFQPPDSVAAKLRALGTDLSLVREDTLDGRPMYVVGARAGDLHTRQFWVDRERLLFTRWIEPARRDSTRTTESRFENYFPSGPAWVSPRVEFKVDGKQVWLEEYVDIKVNGPVPDSLFSPRR